MSIKQDRNGVRTAQDLERKYDFASLVGLKKATENNVEGINKTNTILENFMTVTSGDIEKLQTQIDGSITTWFYSAAPSLSSYPVTEWKESEYNVHLGDLYYDTDTGKAYRFAKQTDDYLWIVITDTDVVQALELANKAQDTADGKRRVFTASPSPPYDEGDLWLNNEELFVCVFSKETGSFASSDFEIATKYTDDTALNTFVGGQYANDLQSVNDQIDKKAETWYQANDPSTNWTTTDHKSSHVGDLWYNTSTNKNYVYNSSYQWKEIDGVPDSVYDEIDGKAQIFASTPTPPYYINDLYVQGTSGDILVCNTERLTGNYTASDWKKASKYTDDSSLTTFMTGKYSTDLQAINNQIDKKSETWYQATDPSATWTTTEIKSSHVGDLWYNTTAKKSYIYSSTYEWKEADGVPDSVYDEIDGKAQIFAVQPVPPYYKNDLYVQGSNGDIYVCNTERLTGIYVSSDWKKASKYTDDSNLNNFVNVTYKESMESLTNQIDSKITTWYFNGTPTLANSPAVDWTTNEEKMKHTGDLYYDKETGYAYMFDYENSIYSWQHIIDSDVVEALAIANSSQDTADSKRRVFLDTPEPPYDNGDLWLNEEEIYVCQISKGIEELYASGDFIIATKYTDDTVANQVGNELTIVKGQVTTIIEDQNEIKVSFTETTNLVSDLTGEIADEVATRTAMIRATSESGLPVIELGSTESPVKTKYRNDGMYIEENGFTTGYFKNGKAYNYDMEILNSLTIGNFSFKPRQNGNLSIVYTGGDE